MSEPVVRVPNWETFQHYKDRSPPWIKLHRQLLTKRQWHHLSGDAAKLLVELWLVASESEDGTIPMSTEDLGWRQRRDTPSVAALLLELEREGFLDLSIHDAGAVLAVCGRDAIPEERRGELQERDIKKLPGRGTDVEKSDGERWAELMGVIRDTAGLGKLDGDRMKRSASVAKQMIDSGETPERIMDAIHGVRYLTDRGKTWLRAREPFDLRALNNTGTLVDHHSGERIERRLYDVGLEANPTTPTPRQRNANPTPISATVHDIADRIQGPGRSA